MTLFLEFFFKKDINDGVNVDVCAYEYKSGKVN